VAERVLKQKHWLQGIELSLVPHYDVLEPEALAEGVSGRDHSATQESGVIGHAPTGTGGLAGALTMAVGSGEAPQQLGTLLRAGPVGAPGQALPVDSGSIRIQGSMGSTSPVDPVESSTELPEQVGPMASDSVGVQEQEGLGEVATGQEGLMGLVGTAMESVETGLESPGYGEMQKQEGLVEMVMSVEPGAVRYLQLYYEDLLASLEDVALFPLEGTDVTGFRVSDPPSGSPQLCLFSYWDPGTFPVL
jgi:poly [ADP-ribose] polymerase 10/14/15